MRRSLMVILMLSSTTNTAVSYHAYWLWYVLIWQLESLAAGHNLKKIYKFRVVPRNQTSTL